MRCGRFRILGLLVVLATGGVGESLPLPGVGLLVTRDEVQRLRAKTAQGVPQRIRMALEARLPQALHEVRALRSYNWPARGTALINAPKSELHAILNPYVDGIPVIASHYLLTGSTNGVEDAIWCMRQLRHYDRIGWFAWNGGAFPHILYGSIFRVTAYAYDWMYDAMTDEARRDVEEVLMMAGRDYFRLNLIGPGMLMHHLRHHNQGNNAFCSGLAATLATRRINPDADRWLRVYAETFLWNLTHAFGPDGQDVENDLQGYWSIALDAVVQSAIMFRNRMGIDFLTHPHLRRAHRFWLAHLAPCKPVAYHGGSERRDSPYDESFEGFTWVQNAPACTVHRATVSHTMLLLAGLNRDGAGMTLWQHSMLEPNGRPRPNILRMEHTGTIGGLLALQWYPADLEPAPIEGPLFFFSERLALWRSGLVPGKDRLFTFNGGQVNWIERGEQLGTGVGLVWHNPHFQYAPAQITLWTEGEDLQPGYRLVASFDGEWAKYLSATGAFSNTRYYPMDSQMRAYRRFDVLERDVLSMAGRYWVILDRVAHAEPRSHAFTWNTLNTDRNASYAFNGNQGTLVRRQAAVDFFFAEPARLSYRIRPTKLMPVWYFSWSDHGLAFEAREGSGMTNIEEIVEIPVNGFMGVEIVENMPSLSLELPTAPTDPLTRTKETKGSESVLTELLGDHPPPADLTARVSVGSESAGKETVRRNYRHKQRFPIQGGRFHTFELVYSKFNLRQYHNPAWQVVATFYDRTGKALNRAGWENPASACLTEADGESAVLDRATVRTTVSVPHEAETVGFELQTWEIFQSSGRPNAATVSSDLYLHNLRMIRHPEPERSRSVRFLTIFQSRDRAESAPVFHADRLPHGSVTRIRRPDGGMEIIVSAEDMIRDPGDAFQDFSGRLGVCSLSRNQTLENAFLSRVTRFISAPLAFELEADQPVTVEKGSSGVVVQTIRTTQLRIRDGSQHAAATLEPGFYRLDRGKLLLIPDRIDPAVESHPVDREVYRDGVGTFFEKQNATVEDPSLGVNRLRQASFRASSVLQPRFDPCLVNDGRIAEAWGDGRLYYKEEEIPSASFGGYGGEWHTATYPWPYRVRPTYWLAGDEEKEAWIEAEMPAPTPIKRIRLHNTANGGFNDRAMVEFRIDLFDEAGTVVASATNHFGTPVPEPVRYSDQSYGGGWRFWFRPETPIPHGEGWKTVELDQPVLARRIRVTCLRYWGYGAGLSELQAY